MQLSSVHLPV